MTWMYVCIGSFIAVMLVVGTWFMTSYSEEIPELPVAPTPVAPLETAKFIEPPTLDDIRITSIRIGNDITILLDWDKTKSELPFHLWVSVEDGNLILHAPDNEPRTVEILPNQALSLFGSTLYHEASDNRLAIDLQVETDNPKE